MYVADVVLKCKSTASKIMQLGFFIDFYPQHLLKVVRNSFMLFLRILNKINTAQHHIIRLESRLCATV